MPRDQDQEQAQREPTADGQRAGEAAPHPAGVPDLEAPGERADEVRGGIPKRPTSGGESASTSGATAGAVAGAVAGMGG